jgi:hypothetical protein
VHVGKFYHFDLFGGLVYEIDYYKPIIDTLWLRQVINGMDTDPPIKDLKCKSYQFSRTYYPQSSAVAFEMELDFGNGLLFSHPIPKPVGDSIYNLVK